MLYLGQCDTLVNNIIVALDKFVLLSFMTVIESCSLLMLFCYNGTCALIVLRLNTLYKV